MEITEQKQIERIYSYEDEKGELLYEVIRFNPKGFSQRRPDGNGGYIYNTQGVRKVLYKLPQLIATPLEVPVFIVEGEKDADRLISEGLPATTNPGGAGKWLPEYNEYFRGRAVAVLPDNDEAGRKHAKMVAGSLCGIAASVKIVKLNGLPPKGDVSDWLDPSSPNGSAVASAGHKFGEISILVDNTPEYVLEEPWTRKADVVKMSEIEPEDVKWLWPGSFPLGMITLLVGDPDLGKSYFSMYVASMVSNGGTWPDGTPCPQAQALILNAEDALANTVRKRLHILGADADKIIAIRAMTEKTEDGQFSDHFNIASDRTYLEEVLRDNPGVRLVVIDPLSAYFGSADTFKESVVRAILSPLADMASRFNVALVCIMHLNKGNSSKALYRTQGSLAFPAAARVVWLVSNDPENPESKRRFLINTKFNIGDRPSSLAFEIIDGKVVFENEPVNVTAQDIFTVKREAPQKEKAIKLLEAQLKGFDSRPAKELFEMAEKEGISAKVLKAAKKELGLKSFQKTLDNKSSCWYWQLPSKENKETKDPIKQSVDEQLKKAKEALKANGFHIGPLEL
jgi:hypothetical protein